ncbi:restriction endonuclease [Mucilaginibacter sp. UYCu711]|uniref:restriction endonuclease n=1 Tax=Mucilaginibacter sp. UYCu711 TaxID=3156339 RepID=UPI003D1FC850
MPHQIVSGITEHFYHTLPDDLDMITTNPLKENIYKMLSQIPYKKFPEFVLDVLIKVEHHTPFDITDGPGDEKQDILTINPKGQRCLTQCKHTINISSHYSGDELDLMVAACLRKDCKEAIFVTNGDLTPQGKKYVTDKEYERGWPDKENMIAIDYWNDLRLWEKIKNNSDILNKWFSGLGQTHLLRSFQFYISIRLLPVEHAESDHEYLPEILEDLVNKTTITKDSDQNLYNGSFKDFSIVIKTGVQIDSQLGVHYINPKDDIGLLHQAVRVLSVKVTMGDAIDKYSPALIKDQIIQLLFKNNLPGIENEKWWHLIGSHSTAFIFLHDIGEPRQITFDSGTTYVKNQKLELINELDYCRLDPNEFSLAGTDEDDDTIWIHKESDVQVIQLFDEKLNPADVYNNQVIQIGNLKTYKDYNFKAVVGVDNKLLMRVRRILPTEWVAVQQDQDTLIWGIPPDTEPDKITKIEIKLKSLGLEILLITSEDRDKLLAEVQNDLPPTTTMYRSDLNKVGFPIDLPGRVFWLQKELKLEKNTGYELAIELLKFKYLFDNLNGFDNLRGQTTMNSHTNELPSLLFDIFTFRGKKMMDIGILNNPITICIRYREEKTEPSNVLALEYLKEFLVTFNEIEYLVNNFAKKNL